MTYYVKLIALVLLFVLKSNLFCQGLKNGLELKYYDNGNIEYAMNYKNSKLDSVSTWYFESGKVQNTITFSDGLKNGIAYFFNENGSVQSIYYNINDSSVLHFQFDSKGNIFREVVNGQQRFYIKGIPYSTKKYVEIKGRKGK